MTAFVRSTAIPFVVVIAATAGLLRMMGRTWWCSCGQYVPWSWDIWSKHNSQHLIDPYTLTHLLHGVLFCAAIGSLSRLWSKRSRQPERRGEQVPIGLPTRTAFLIAVVIEAGWEILENSPIIIERYRAATISLDYYGDSIANSISDILACALGFLLASRTALKWWLVMFLGAELLLLLTIRDCLTLNVIMLVYPIEAIKAWQVAVP